MGEGKRGGGKRRESQTDGIAGARGVKKGLAAGAVDTTDQHLPKIQRSERNCA